MKGIKKVQWHADLPDEAKQRIEWTYRVVGHFFKPTLEQWEHGFCYNALPDREIMVWLRVSFAWLRFCREYPEAAEDDPKGFIATMAGFSLGSDVSGRPWAQELADCYRDPQPFFGEEGQS